MAFRLQFMPQAVGVLSACQPAVRERVLHELGAIFSGPLLGTQGQTAGAEHSGACLLPSGFHVHYAVDWKHGLLHLLELKSPDDELSAPLS
ncbi:hypothetical protein [Hyalangium versicolor]|uniref:hypothetical protein n=1 Tax=Hyalangium versicolor TaxID=2861190 RepID=UPI001CCF6840|nr:hypothetical protein [Hyalangium versicolor]